MKLFGEIWVRAKRHEVSNLSAQVSFWTLLSAPGVLLAVVGGAGAFSKLLSPTAAIEVRNRIVGTLRTALSGDVLDGATKLIDTFMFRETKAVIGVGLLLALWSGSRATGAFFDATRLAYETPTEQSKFRQRLKALIYTISFSVISILVLALVVAGPAIGGALGRSVGAGGFGRSVFELAWWPIAFVAIILSVAFSYRVACPRGRIFPGAVFAAVGWIGAILGLKAYTFVVIDGSTAYGPLAAPVVVLLLVFISVGVLLLGAELNATLDSRRGP